MTTLLRVIDRPGDDAPIGFWRDPAWWGCMWRDPDCDLPDRESWFIVLPNCAGGWSTTNRASIRHNDGTIEHAGGCLWTVTGTPPKITVTPSIDAGPYWHGWITDGVMTP